jgi:TDG/mug DNA glycosylase family protein
MGFYITDFVTDQQGFTEGDLDGLISRGIVRISEQSHPAKPVNWERDPGPHAAHASLPRLLCPDLDVIFVGTEPGWESIRTGNYYANPGNSFYADLANAGFTPERFSPERHRELLAHGIGLDDVYENPVALRARIEAARPKAVCFNSKDALERFAGPVGSNWRGEAAAELARFEGVAIIWAVPDSSGQAAAYRDDRDRLLRELEARLDAQRRPQASNGR